MNSSSLVSATQTRPSPSSQLINAPLLSVPSPKENLTTVVPSMSRVTPSSQGVVNRILEVGRGISLASSSVQRATSQASSKDGNLLARASDFADQAVEIYKFIVSEGQHHGLSISLDQDPKDIARDVGRIGEAYIRKDMMPVMKDALVDALTSKFGMGATSVDSLIGTSSAGSSVASSPGAPASLGEQVLGAAGVAYTAFDLLKNYGKYSPVEGALRGATAGAYLGTHILPGIGTLLGGVIGGLGGLLGGLFKRSGKSKEQKERDQIRNVMKQIGIIDSGNALTLADGTRYDIGKDGGHTLQNVDGSNRRAFEVDFGHPLAAEVVGMANPLAALLTGGRVDRQSDIAGYIVNAALSNGNSIEEAKANMQAIVASFKVAPEQILSGIGELQKGGIVGEEVALAYVNGLASIFDLPRQVPVVATL